MKKNTKSGKEKSEQKKFINFHITTLSNSRKPENYVAHS